MGMLIGLNPSSAGREFFDTGIKSSLILTSLLHCQQAVQASIQKVWFHEDNPEKYEAGTLLFSTFLVARTSMPLLKTIHNPKYGTTLFTILRFYSWRQVLSLGTKESLLFSSFALSGYLNHYAKDLSSPHDTLFGSRRVGMRYGISFLSGIIGSFMSYSAEIASKEFLKESSFNYRTFLKIPPMRVAGMGVVSLIYSLAVDQKLIS